MTSPAEDDLWEDPRRWRSLRRARFLKTLGVSMIALATALFIPSLWILVMPQDTLLRPTLLHAPAMVALGLCLILLYGGRGIVRSARNTYGAVLYGCLSRARQIGSRDGLVFDIEMQQVYPRVLFARPDRVIAICYPSPVIMKIDEISAIVADDDGLITLRMTDPKRPAMNLMAGDGLTLQSRAETDYVADRLREFVFMQPNLQTDEERQQDELARAFAQNPSLR